MRRPTALALSMGASVLVGGVVAIGGPPAGAAACSVEQITHTSAGTVRDVAISADGSMVAFAGDIDPLGSNPDRNGELFTYDVDQQVLAQQTVTTGGDAGPATPSANGQPTLDEDGSVLFFQSNRDLTGQNADGSWEIFALAPGGTPVQRTFGAAGQHSRNPATDATGQRVAYDSKGDPLGQNPEGNQEVFQQRGTNTLHVTDQITAEAAGVTSGNPSVDRTGRRVLFVTDGPLGGPSSSPEPEAVLHRFSDDFHSGTTQAVAPGEGWQDRFVPVLSGDGSAVAFTSGRDLDGSNDDGSFELWRVDVATGAVAALTHQGSASSDPFRPFTDQLSLDTTGQRVAFWGSSSLVGQGLAVRELLVFDGLGPDRLDEVRGPNTYVGGSEGPTAMDGTGSHLVYATSGNVVGGNGDGNQELHLATCGAAQPQLADVPETSPFFDEIQWMAARGITGGYADGTFRPAAGVNRQQMAAFLFRLAGSPATTPPSTPTFADVPAGHPFRLEIEWMAAEGISGGYPDGTFRPAAGVNRQQMAAFLFRLAGSPATTPPSTPTFADVPADHPFAAQIEWMVDVGVTGGYADGTFRPAAGVNRQQMAAFLHRFTACCGSP